MRRKIRKRGFTLIEVIIVVSVMLVLSGVALLTYNGYVGKEKVRQAFFTLRSDLRLAQTKAESGLKPVECEGEVLEGYEVTFQETSYSIAPRCTISTSIESERMTVELPNGVTFSPIPSSFLFYPLMRGTSISGSLSVSLVGEGSYTRTLTVSPSGTISVSE